MENRCCSLLVTKKLVVVFHTLHLEYTLTLRYNTSNNKTHDVCQFFHQLYRLFYTFLTLKRLARFMLLRRTVSLRYSVHGKEPSGNDGARIQTPPQGKGGETLGTRRQISTGTHWCVLSLGDGTGTRPRHSALHLHQLRFQKLINVEILSRCISQQDITKKNK